MVSTAAEDHVDHVLMKRRQTMREIDYQETILLT